MKLAHEALMAGHLGVKNTTERVQTDFFGLEFKLTLDDSVALVMYVNAQFPKEKYQQYHLVRCLS
jgi:hypothetical protein